MRKLVLITCFLSLMFACENATMSGNKPKKQALVDISNLQESVEFLCNHFKQLDNINLSDEAHKQLQIEVEALYLGLEFGVNARFYSDEDILRVADSLGCIL